MKSCAEVRGEWQQQKDGFENPQKKRKKSSDAHLHFELILVDLEEEV